MALESTAARRYAEALLEATPRDDLARARDDLARFAATVDATFDLRNVLLNPAFGEDERARVLDRVMDHLALGEVTRRFLRLVLERDRMLEVAAIAESFRKLADDRAGRIRAEVRSAGELTPTAAEQLRAALERRTGKKVDLAVTVDPELIGGLRAQVGSLVFDGTLRAELQRLRATLTAGDARATP
jgi:F-type H+-transporting ATPase subunit delta